MNAIECGRRSLPRKKATEGLAQIASALSILKVGAQVPCSANPQAGVKTLPDRVRGKIGGKLITEFRREDAAHLLPSSNRIGQGGHDARRFLVTQRHLADSLISLEAGGIFYPQGGRKGWDLNPRNV